MLSEETRRNMSEAQRGKLVTDDIRKKLSDANIGQKRSEETRRKMSAAQKKRFGTDPNIPTERELTCQIIKKHHEILKEDPERLSTDFIQKIIGIDCLKL
jgi:hypothetical protein